MSQLTDVFNEYRSAAEAMGATDAARVVSPASDQELQRLNDFLEGEVPDQLVEWFTLCNGADKKPAVGRQPPMLFPEFESYSLTWLLDKWERYGARFEEPAEYGPSPRKPFPILLDESLECGMWVECADNDGRLIYFGEQEFCGTHNGYYHNTPYDFVAGCLTNLQAGHYEIYYGGIATPLPGKRDWFHFPIDFTALGFQRENGLPPRLPWPTSDYDGVDLNDLW